MADVVRWFSDQPPDIQAAVLADLKKVRGEDSTEAPPPPEPTYEEALKIVKREEERQRKGLKAHFKAGKQVLCNGVPLVVDHVGRDRMILIRDGYEKRKRKSKGKSEGSESHDGDSN